MKKLDELLEKIEEMREEMISLGVEKGIQDPAVLKKSQELDKLLVQLHKLKRGQTKRGI